MSLARGCGDGAAACLGPTRAGRRLRAGKGTPRAAVRDADQCRDQSQSFAAGVWRDANLSTETLSLTQYLPTRMVAKARWEAQAAWSM